MEPGLLRTAWELGPFKLLLLDFWDKATGSRAPFALARACERLYVPCTKRDDAADTYGVGFVSTPFEERQTGMPFLATKQKGYTVLLYHPQRKRDERICPSQCALPVLVLHMKKNQLQLCAGK